MTFWSWFALILLVARAMWFQRRVRHDEALYLVGVGMAEGKLPRWPFMFPTLRAG